MNSKDYKKYNLIVSIANASVDSTLIEKFAELISTDFSVAADVWEFKLAAVQSQLGNNEISNVIETDVFALFQNASENRTKQFLVENPPLVKLIYGVASSSCTQSNLQFLTNQLLSSKMGIAEDILKCVKSNSNIDFGESMKNVLDNLFSTYCTKNNVKKAELTRKQSALLLEYISKIKGPNRILLTQRIKEL